MVKTKREGQKSSKDKRKHTAQNKKPPHSSIQKSQRLLLAPPKPHRKTNQSSGKGKAPVHLAGKQNMPSLSDLEKMYEESEEEMESGNIVTSCSSKDTCTSSLNITIPDHNSTSSSIGPISPTTAKKYADEILKILDSNEAPLSIIPMKKYKKSDVPYIVNCTERPRIPESKTCNVFKGDAYGISSKTNAFSVEDTCNDSPGSNFNCSGYQFSKSIFNAQANEIASKLLLESNNAIISSDSDDTVVYELNTPANRFSPQPSTSKDSETIQKNDQKFIECFDQKIEVKETAVVKGDDTFIADIVNSPIDNAMLGKSAPQHVSQANGIVDKLKETNNNKSYNSDFDNDVNIIERPCVTIVIDDDDDCDITDYKKVKDTCAKLKGKSDTPKVHKVHRNPFDPQVIAEIDLTNVNVEDVISENQSLINKYSKHNTLNSVNIVEADVVARSSEGNSNMHKNMLNSNNLQDNQNNLPPTSNIYQHNSFGIDSYPDNLENILTDCLANFLQQHNNSNSTQQSNLSNQEKVMPNVSVSTVNNDVNSPQSKNNFPENSNSQQTLGTCPICLDDLARDKVGSTNCGHLFCMPCISAALKPKPKRCPSCRKKLTGKGYHQIYL